MTDHDPETAGLTDAEKVLDKTADNLADMINLISEDIAGLLESRKGLIGSLDMIQQQLPPDRRMPLDQWPPIPDPMGRTVTPDDRLAVSYLRYLASLRPDDASALRLGASDIEAGFHRDPELNPASSK